MNQRIPFSAVVVTYNEADLLPDCLKSLSFCDELIVIDLGSTDDSVAIASSQGARILYHPRDPVVENVRAYGFQHTTNDWIIFLDPDERIHPALVDQIQDIIASNPRVGQIALPWQFYFKGRKLTVTTWGQREKVKGVVIHKHRVHTHHLVHGGCVPREGYEQITIEREGEAYISHYWMQSYRELIRKHWMYIRETGKARYSQGHYSSWKAVIVGTAVQWKHNFIDLNGWRGGWTGIFLSFFWAWYVLMCELSLWHYQRQARRQELAENATL
jgi:glycosyltransferase involved in cell wall biosynthesis